MALMKIIPDFLPEDYFASIEKDLVWNHQFPYYLLDKCNSSQTDDSQWMMSHTGYIEDTARTDLYTGMLRAIHMLPDFRTLIRLKANFYPQTTEMVEHARHVDFDFSHHGAILSFNTCDGFTRLEDGTKVESVRNRLLIFDGSTMHNSSTTTDAKGRFNININYL